MADVRTRVAAEMENVERALRGIPPASECPRLSQLELAGVAALLHNFYNGVENILKQVLQHRDVAVPVGDSWHRNLLAAAAECDIVSHETLALLKPYLAFRHYFSHSYAFDLQAARLNALIADAATVLSALKRDIEKALSS